MDGEGRDVDRPVALDHAARRVDADQVRHPDLAEVHAERIDPEGIGELRVARGDVAGNSLAEAEGGEDPEPAGQPLLAVPALLDEIGENRRRQLPEGGRIGFGLGAG